MTKRDRKKSKTLFLMRYSFGSFRCAQSMPNNKPKRGGEGDVGRRRGREQRKRVRLTDNQRHKQTDREQTDTQRQTDSAERKRETET